ncbi:hypothetical protein CDV55_102929, partial [Aspergillus turcosus]
FSAAYATVEVWGTRVHFTDINGNTALHRFHQHLKKAYREDHRDLDLPVSFTRELHRHGFVNIAEHVHIVPMDATPQDLETRILANWASGFEARSLELMNRKLGMKFLPILLECAEARRAISFGVGAFFEIRGKSSRLWAGTKQLKDAIEDIVLGWAFVLKRGSCVYGSGISEEGQKSLEHIPCVLT